MALRIRLRPCSWGCALTPRSDPNPRLPGPPRSDRLWALSPIGVSGYGPRQGLRSPHLRALAGVARRADHDQVAHAVRASERYGHNVIDSVTWLAAVSAAASVAAPHLDAREPWDLPACLDDLRVGVRVQRRLLLGRAISMTHRDRPSLRVVLRVLRKPAHRGGSSPAWHRRPMVSRGCDSRASSDRSRSRARGGAIGPRC